MVIQHLTNLYASEHQGIETFILADGGIYTQIFWIGQITIGAIIPLILLYHPKTSKNRNVIALTSTMIIVGGFAQLYVIIIAGQAFPLSIFPGFEETSTFYDGVVASYTPSLPEVLLGLGGFAITFSIIAIALRALPFLPATLADADVDPNYVLPELNRGEDDTVMKVEKLS